MHLIFDFDGTLANSFELAMAKFNELAEKFRFRKIDPPDFMSLRDLNSRELIKYLKIPLYKIPAVLHYARKEMNASLPTITPVNNIHYVLQKLKNANFSLGILTSNSAENVTTWLKLNNLQHFFEFVHAKSNYFGKNLILKKLLKKYHFSKPNVFYVGDETRDIDAAKQNDIHSIAVTWGFNSEKVLLEHEPTHIAREPINILEICKI